MVEGHCRSQDVVVGDGACKLEVAVGDGAHRVIEGDKFVLDELGEWGTPKDWPLESVLGSWLDSEGCGRPRGEPDSTHSDFCSIHRSEV